jgi:hypothetical protein
MKKHILLITLTLLTNSIFAQIDINSVNTLDSNSNVTGSTKSITNSKFDIAKKNAQYNGYIVGYSKSCKLNAQDILKIENLLFKNFQTVELSKYDIDSLRKIYLESVDNAEKNGLTHSKNECAIFSQEFNKIITAINSTPTPIK